MWKRETNFERRNRLRFQNLRTHLGLARKGLRIISPKRGFPIKKEKKLQIYQLSLLDEIKLFVFY